jgi:hypothetical protein
LLGEALFHAQLRRVSPIYRTNIEYKNYSKLKKFLKTSIFLAQKRKYKCINPALYLPGGVKQII